MTDLECLKLVEFLVSVNEFPSPEEREHIIHDIYASVHSHLTKHSCYDVHENWRKRAEELLEHAKAQGFPI